MSLIDDLYRRELQGLQRQQVLRGVAEAVASKGYSATTISDIAAAARASRSTVYAHFPDKDSALVALHRELIDRLVESVLDAHRLAPSSAAWRDRLQVLVDAYLDAMASASAGERASLLEVASAGPQGRRSRREAHDRFAQVVSDISTDLAVSAPDAVTLDASMALGAVAAINELVQRAAEDGPDAIRALKPIAGDLLARLMRRSPSSSTF